MKRRAFLKTVGGVSLVSVLGEFVRASEPAPPDLRSLFEADNPDVLALAERVMAKCVLDKIMPPTPPLKNTWIVPGGPYYKGQWIWDTMFVVDLLSILPGRKKLIRDVFQNYWDFQNRWNADAPEYARDMITVAIKTVPQEVRQFSQIPILAWGSSGSTDATATKNFSGNVSVGSNGSTTGIGASGICTTTGSSLSAPTRASCSMRNGRRSTTNATWTT